MLPEFSHKCLEQLLTSRQYVTLRITVLILQSYRTIRDEEIERIDRQLSQIIKRAKFIR